MVVRIGLTRVVVIVGTACLIRAARDRRRTHDVIGALCGDMVFWGNREGGIPAAYWEDYRAGRALVGLMAVLPPGESAATGECDAGAGGTARCPADAGVMGPGTASPCPENDHF
ncbi:MAG: hypothetical protein M3008_01535 [Chloroflexota bacterium]|nr:hypothetical protein [Chloroflexota bacterium]